MTYVHPNTYVYIIAVSAVFCSEMCPENVIILVTFWKRIQVLANGHSRYMVMFWEGLRLRKRERDVLYVRLSRSAESLIVFPGRAALCLVLSPLSPTMRHLPLLQYPNSISPRPQIPPPSWPGSSRARQWWCDTRKGFLSSLALFVPCWHAALLRQNRVDKNMPL